MNDFKEEILTAISNHPMVTYIELMDDMMLSHDFKPKLARCLSELKKDGYLTSVKGESKLLQWELTDKANEHLLQMRDEQAALLDPVGDYSEGFEDINVDFSTGYETEGDYSVSYSVRTAKGEEIKGCRNYSEAIQTAKAKGGGTIWRVKKKPYATVTPSTHYDVKRL